MLRPTVSLKFIIIISSVAAGIAVAAYGYRFGSSSIVDYARTAGLRIEAEHLQLGRIPAQAKYNWQLPVMNRSSDSLHVSGFQTSCSCIRIEPRRFTLAPGAKQVLTVSLNSELATRSAVSQGETDAPLRVALVPMVDGAAPAKGWQLSATVYAPYRCTPPTADFSSITRNQATRVKVVHVVSDQELADLEVHADSQFEAAATRVDSRNYSLTITCKPPTEIGRFVGQITLTGRKFDGGTVPGFALHASGEVVSEVRASPPAVVLSANASSVVFVTLTSRSGEPFRLHDAAIPATGFEVIFDPDAISTERLVEIRYHGNASTVRDQMTCRISFSTNAGDPRDVSIPVFVLPAVRRQVGANSTE